MSERRRGERRKKDARALLDARNGRRRQDGRIGWVAFGILLALVLVVGLAGAYLSSLVMM